MKKLGVIVNPIAGIGGRVGLKGSDGFETLEKARRLGAVPECPRRAAEALNIVSRIKDRIEVISYPYEMGEDECRESGLSPTVIGSIKRGETTPTDTENAARQMVIAGVDLILFAGGDGTARNLYHAIGEKVPVLGIPAGVKIHSAVFAVTPRSAGEVTVMFLEGGLLRTRESEVMDIDEEAFREGQVTAKLCGYLRVPDERRFIQSVKSGGIHAEKETLLGIAADIIDAMEEGCFYIIGPGTTTRVIMETLGITNTLLGVDLVWNRQLVATDANENQLLDHIQGKMAKIVLTIIGGQGHIFGRGNQQISPRIIREVGRDRIIVIATKEKLASLRGRPLLVDTGDQDLDQMLSGYIRVTAGFGEYVMYRVGYNDCAKGTGDT